MMLANVKKTEFKKKKEICGHSYVRVQLISQLGSHNWESIVTPGLKPTMFRVARCIWPVDLNDPEAHNFKRSEMYDTSPFLQALLDNKSRHKWHYGAVVKLSPPSYKLLSLNPGMGPFSVMFACPIGFFSGSSSFLSQSIECVRVNEWYVWSIDGLVSCEGVFLPITHWLLE